MGDKLEEAALSGKLFSNASASTPPRQRSPSPSGSRERRRSSSSSSSHAGNSDAPAQPSAPPPSIPNTAGGGSGSSNTGSKGVMTDARAAASSASAARSAQLHSIQAEQARKAMVAMTVDEEAAARARDEGQTADADRAKWNAEAKEDALARERWRAQRRAEIERERNKGREDDGLARSKMGLLKEVGGEGFVRAVERDGWVLVLIYEPGIPRCSALTASLLSLSLTLSSPGSSSNDPFATPPPSIALYRARARALRFSLLPATEGAASADEDELAGFDGDDDIDADGVSYDQDSGLDEIHDVDVDDDGNLLGRPDPDVLPTLLAYKDGELVKTWVRVDWEVGEDGVEGLLKREGILPRDTGRAGAGAGVVSGDEDD